MSSLLWQRYDEVLGGETCRSEASTCLDTKREAIPCIAMLRGMLLQAYTEPGTCIASSALMHVACNRVVARQRLDHGSLYRGTGREASHRRQRAVRDRAPRAAMRSVAGYPVAVRIAVKEDTPARGVARERDRCHHEHIAAVHHVVSSDDCTSVPGHLSFARPSAL